MPRRLLILFPVCLSFVSILLFTACIKNDVAGTEKSITAFICSAVINSSSPLNGIPFVGTASLPYAGGKGVSYAAGSSIPSSGILGLTAKLQPGSLAMGAGSLLFNITGTPAGTGTATFAIAFGGQSCSLSLQVNSTSNTTCTDAVVISNVVAKANAFKALLSLPQLASVQLQYTKADAVKWSDLPCGSSCRNGIRFSTLSPIQLKAASDVIIAALGTNLDEGSDEWEKIRTTDVLLGRIRGFDMYSDGLYYIAFLGTPGINQTWQLQLGGHHSAVNITYESDVVAGVTPMFEGLEPSSWQTGSTRYIPLNQERDAMAALLASFSPAQLAAAKLSTTFSEVVLGPGKDGQFPATKLGIAVSKLLDEQKLLVLAAMKPWLLDADASTAACLLNIYKNELDKTYVAFSGNTLMTANEDYVRIDGPGVWIEFLCQTGVVYTSQIHYHSVWRDHVRDYGGNFTF